MSKQKFLEPEFESNSQLFSALLFEKEVSQWIGISKCLNILLTYAMPPILSDGAMLDVQDQTDLQELLSFKTELEKSTLYTLINIPK